MTAISQSVSKIEFFATVGKLNVHPRVDIGTLKGRYHVSHWEMQDGTRTIIGRSVSDSWSIDPARYFLLRQSEAVT